MMKYDKYFGSDSWVDWRDGYIQNMDSFLTAFSVTEGYDEAGKDIGVSIKHKTSRGGECDSQSWEVSYLKVDGSVFSKILLGVSFDEENGATIDISYPSLKVVNSSNIQGGLSVFKNDPETIFSSYMNFTEKTSGMLSNDRLTDGFKQRASMQFKRITDLHYKIVGCGYDFESLPLSKMAEMLRHFRSRASIACQQPDPEGGGPNSPSPAAPAMALKKIA
jgi:hypothetical protein